MRGGRGTAVLHMNRGLSTEVLCQSLLGAPRSAAQALQLRCAGLGAWRDTVRITCAA
jgi:hypothetical protein